MGGPFLRGVKWNSLQHFNNVAVVGLFNEELNNIFTDTDNELWFRKKKTTPSELLVKWGP